LKTEINQLTKDNSRPVKGSAERLKCEDEDEFEFSVIMGRELLPETIEAFSLTASSVSLSTRSTISTS
jgi:hypothetical protein